MNAKSSSSLVRLLSIVTIAVSWISLSKTGSADIVDEAKAQGKSPSDFPADDFDYFRDMDMRPDGTTDANGNSTLKPLDLTADEIKGRNTWMMWCGGNEVFWDYLSTHSYGFMDLLKLCDFSPDDKLAGKRWGPAGLSIEPGTKVPEKPDEYGLYVRQTEDPNTRQPDPKIYGRSSGIVGLRLFPNPKFDEKARKNWDIAKNRKDENYNTNPDLVRPYRVGMSCVFCHVAAHPLSPPADPEAPKWANLSTTIGAQYLRVSAVVGNLLHKDNVVFHVLDSQPPGTVDTSLVATDQINNANTMNALFDFGARLDRSGIFGHRTPEYAKEYNERYGHNDFEQASPESAIMPVLLYNLPDPYANPRPVPRILMEGADSVGAWGALARVHLNIGLFSERWVTLCNILIGFRDQQPFKLADLKKNSIYWQVTEHNVDYLAKFFLKSTGPMRLKDAPAGKQLGQLKGPGVPWAPELTAGRKVFADRCIICHSSKQPNGLNGAPLGPEKVPGAQLVAHLRDPGYHQWALAEVEKQDFWENNFLSSEVRIPVTVVKTNASRAMATNGIKGHMWEDFSSETYKNLPAVGKITSWNPFTQQDFEWDAPGNGRGYYRPASLIGLWATAPFLHNNTVGLFNNDPSVKGRLEAFDDGIHRLLTPGKTDEEAATARYSWAKGPAVDTGGPINNATLERLKTDHGLIWRTPTETHLHIPASDILAGVLGITSGPIMWILVHLWIIAVAILLIALLLLLGSQTHTSRRRFGIFVLILGVAFSGVAAFLAGNFGDLDTGPIPAGTPVDLLANIKPGESKKLGNIHMLVGLLKKVKAANTDAERQKANAELATKLLSISNSPDLVMDNGHYFGKDLTPQELEDLIDLLKTF
ncbi:MAG: hypothetical protein QOE34_2377 [Verrucomicrobiota bacterium]